MGINQWYVLQFSLLLSNSLLVENEQHCEFVHLRNFLFRTHLQDMIESTSSIHYEGFRTRQLLALKESTGLRQQGQVQQNQQQAQGH